MAGLMVEPAEWHVRKEADTIEDQAKAAREGMIATRDKAKAHAKAVLATNENFVSRKRQAQSNMSEIHAKRPKSQASRVLVKDTASDDLNQTVNLDGPTVVASEVKFGLSTKHGICSWSNSEKKFVRKPSSETDNEGSETPSMSPILAPLPVTPEEDSEVFVFVASTPAVGADARGEPENVFDEKSHDVTGTISCEELATRSSDVEFLLKNSTQFNSTLTSTQYGCD